MRHLFLALAVLLAFASCDKEEACERSATGTLCFENQTSTTVAVDPEGLSTFSLAPGDTKCFDEVSAGVRNYTALSTDGYFYDNTTDVRQCREVVVQLRK